MNAVRPGTASRLKTSTVTGATALRPGTRTGAGGASILSKVIRVEDRPITQQGLSGPRTAMRSTRRQVEDKSYFLGVLRGKINEINAELGLITNQTAEVEEENASFVQYEQMAEKLALEIRDLQGELGDYNTFVDKATLGDDVTHVEMDCEDLRLNNERTEGTLEALFEERHNKDAKLKAVELELKQEQQMSENLVQEMDDTQRQNYLHLKNLNSHLSKQLVEGQGQLQQLAQRRMDLEDDLSNSHIKQEAMRLYSQLHECEAKRAQLMAEEETREDPQKERERLLQQVREDNQEIASMERQTRETQEKVSNREEELQLLERELDEYRTERTQKYRELKKREQQIDEFLRTFDEVKALELSSTADLQKQTVELLESISRHMNNMNRTSSTAATVLASTGDSTKAVDQMKEQLSFKSAEVSKSEETATALTSERMRLSQDLLKVDQLETKVTEEMDALRKRIAKMEEEIEALSDLDKVKDDAQCKRETLATEKQRLERHRESLHQVNQELSKEYANIQAHLASQDTHVQLTNLERRWAHHEQVNYELMESVAEKRAETDHSGLAKKAMEMIRAYNEKLKASLAAKPVVS